MWPPAIILIFLKHPNSIHSSPHRSYDKPIRTTIFTDSLGLSEILGEQISTSLPHNKYFNTISEFHEWIHPPNLQSTFQQMQQLMQTKSHWPIFIISKLEKFRFYIRFSDYDNIAINILFMRNVPEIKTNGRACLSYQKPTPVFQFKTIHSLILRS